jgi:hypothetical protein
MSVTTVGQLPNGKSPSDAFLTQSEVDLLSNTVEGILAGLVSIDLTGLASPVTLDTTLGSAPVAQARNMVVVFTGTLTGNVVVNFPNWAGKLWAVVNNTSGAFTLTCKVSGQTGVVITQGFDAILYGNGTDVARVTGDASATALIRGTIGPNGTQQHTLPAVASDTIVLLAAAQTLSNKSLGTNLAAGGFKVTGLAQATASGDAVHGGRQVASGTGLSGGGDLTADRTLALSSSAQQALPNPNITVGAKSGTTIPVSVQFRDFANNNLGQRMAARMWLSDAQNAAPTATAPDGGWSATAGYKVVDVTANIVGEFASDGTGLSTISITQSTARTWYLHVAVGNRVYVSGAIAF